MIDQGNNPHDSEAPHRLVEDLTALCGTGLPVPPEVDESIRSLARQHFAARRRGRMVLRLVEVTAAAAAIALVVTLGAPFFRTSASPSKHEYAPVAQHPAADSKLSALGSEHPVADIDRSGRVDILDAFVLARHIKGGDQLRTEWDLNGDGVVDRTDVDKIALTAVSLERG